MATPHAYIPPKLKEGQFNCPKCHVYAKQYWSHLFLRRCEKYLIPDDRFMVSSCCHCGFLTIWFDEQMIFPDYGAADPPSPDLPEDIQQDYEEARTIMNRSPRGAAALLRLAIQKLCKHLGQSGTSINDDIKALVQKGLPLKVQEALDVVRVIGNEAVHPGELDIRDDRETVAQLFKLVNFIATKMISEPKEIDEIYNALPQNKRNAIDKRDGKWQGGK